MRILVLCIADGDYAVHARVLQEQFLSNIINPEGHDITFRVDSPNNDFDYLSFMNEWHPGTRISLSRFKYFDDSDFDRIIYLDSDMSIVGNVDLLISNELNSCDYWACHVHGYYNYYGDRMKLRGVTEDIIINGGLQVLNKPLLNKHFHECLLNSMEVGCSFDGSDQGYLTEAFRSLDVIVGWLDDKYNFCLQDSFHPICDDVRINHYTGVKPWQNC